MFKWACLGVATAFLGFVAWALNDMRVQVKRTLEPVQRDLPPILAETRKTTTAVSEEAPGIVQDARSATDALGGLAGDVKRLRQALAKVKADRDPELVAYAASVIGAVAASGGTVSTKAPSALASGLENPIPAKAWAATAQTNSHLDMLLSNSKLELLTRLTSNRIGSPFMIQVGRGRRVPMLDWLRQNHEDTKKLFE